MFNQPSQFRENDREEARKTSSAVYGEPTSVVYVLQSSVVSVEAENSVNVTEQVMEVAEVRDGRDVSKKFVLLLIFLPSGLVSVCQTSCRLRGL